VLPRFRFDAAEVIVSFDADFLGTWISPVEYTAAYAAGRTLSGTPPRLSYHAQIESRLSLTGSRADWREALAPGEIGLAMAHLAVRVADRAGLPSPVAAALPAPPIDAAALDALADRVWHARGRTLVVCGSQEPPLQLLCSFINHAVGAYSATVDLERPSSQRAGSDRELEALVAELTAGQVAALFLAGVNPVYDLPNSAALAERIGRVPLVVSFADHLDETSSLAQYVCPDLHYLESWGDAEAVAGLISVTQPAVGPLGGGRQLIESLAAWSGAPQSAYDLLRAHWQRAIYPRRLDEQPFEAFWDRAVHDGVVTVKPEVPAIHAFAWPGPVELPAAARAAAGGGDASLALVLYPSVAMLDGRHAHNPWLHELPDPISKIAWDNAASLSPGAAARLGVADGDVVRLEPVEGPTGAASTLELSVHVQPGQHDAVVAVALGYGRAGTERFATVGPPWLEARTTVGPNGLVGVRASELRRLGGGGLQDSGRVVRVTRTGRRRLLATTQTHHRITVPEHLAPPGGAARDVFRETTLAAYEKDPSAGAHGRHKPPGELWPPDHPYTGHRWAMVIDLNACTGCEACVVACQVENNVPVVGRDEMRRHREMHWIRIDRYYSDAPGGGVDVAFQPMMCQHCEHAPCEVVCPVLATFHSSEGLNQQVYNRCVGTRYCANNCPYKTRRFNWFDYPHDDHLQNLVYNPDVVVRSRGVMEKGSLCIQRIQDAGVEARRAGQPLGRDAIETACQQSCPARAITFGDANDPESRVADLIKSPRYFRVLEEINVRPSVGYLTLVRNRAEETGARRHG
jgi:molybdopterin-containing oxidoreductase family iron-sulfur binding subunit